MNMYVVTQSVADLRREPSMHKGEYAKDALQETQLLFGEPLIGKEEKGGWVLVEAIEQLCFKEGWKGYPGWVKADQIKPIRAYTAKELIVQEGKTVLFIDEQPALTLSLGTKLTKQSELQDKWQVKLDDGEIGTIPKQSAIEVSTIQSLDDKAKRKRLVQFGKTMLGAPYLWGGRSTFDPDNRQTLTSVDCSGFSSLLYRVAYGLDIPRDAHDQYLKCSNCSPANLQIGDFIFLASASRPDRMNHVMLYAGFDEILEATEQTHSVQIISLKEKIGHSLKDLSHEMKVTIQKAKGPEDYILFFGKFS